MKPEELEKGSIYKYIYRYNITCKLIYISDNIFEIIDNYMFPIGEQISLSPQEIEALQEWHFQQM